MSPCARCGRSVQEHDRQVRFRLPDPVLRAPDQDRAPGTWKTDEDPHAAVMMLVPELGAFVRALLPVRLTGGYTVTFGVWVGVDPDELGRLANALPAWEVFGAPVTLAVTDPEATPSCVGSSDPTLASVLTTEWDHEPVLAGLPD